MTESHPMPTHTRFQDLTGQRFGRWTVLAYAGHDKYRASYWQCRCDCGNTKRVRGGDMRRGKSICCGRTHGKWGCPSHNSWSDMIQRCANPNKAGHANYGGRGITVCGRWRKFENFYADMGDRTAGLTLDRVDNDKGYSPENCRWATRRQQNRNSRHNRRLSLNGRTQCVAAWAEELGIKGCTLRKRLRLGWSTKRALTTLVK